MLAISKNNQFKDFIIDKNQFAIAKQNYLKNEILNAYNSLI